ncbi:armadillo-type fold-containing protein [Calothrix sp. FACHB-1219]|uniref:armadillo-type fold-containing protein n=1 Tax=unclassified Calothrix TaxID=2619626 RepID=UPI001688687E|nr:armadillo-type fold-containing protein [Calothrix sp. FACHB-168]MBD2204983.1 armadillo-type fold-containing protein [Calothrix sp. FACHB-168]MBD2216193.1 armadillo-type fold-containing protein [Calothrix sp. FACHB-1219]
MAQALSSWQQLINQLSHWSLPDFKTGASKQRKYRQFSGPGGVLGLLTIIVAMLLWNWKLLLALLIGIGVMLSVYLMQKWDWQQRLSQMQGFVHAPNRQLILAVSSGGIATFTSYIAAAIWFDSNSPWIAAGVIFQGVGTLLSLILLVSQIVNFYGIRQEDQCDRLLDNLTEADPLKRLVAVRQLTKLVSRKRVDASVKQNVIECLQLLLTQEQEAVIREAAFASLQTLDSAQVLPTNTSGIFIPVSNKVKTPIPS